MKDSLIRVKHKLRRSIEGISKDYPSSLESKKSQYLSTKPLPYPPEHHTEVSRPTVLQVNAYGPEQSVQDDNSALKPASESNKTSNQHLPELDFDRLSIDDPSETPDDDQDLSPTKVTHRSDERFCKRLSNNSQQPVLDLNDTGDVSHKIQHDPTAISSIIPDRTSSERFRTGPNDAIVGSHNLNRAPDAEAAIRRKRVSPHAQLPPESDLSNTVDTTVETKQAPAVTHEVRHKVREEIIHERVTRDIHVDHYYDYTKPIKKVIINPAVHFTIDKNGEKVRIPTPDCWVPPPGFTPTKEVPQASNVVPGFLESIHGSHQKADSDA